jgi:hypothetical protein
MHIFDTNKVPRVVLQFLWTGTHLGGNGANVPHEPGTTAPPGMTCRMDLPGSTASMGTRTDYLVGPWDYPTCAARHLMA